MTLIFEVETETYKHIYSITEQLKQLFQLIKNIQMFSKRHIFPQQKHLGMLLFRLIYLELLMNKF